MSKNNKDNPPVRIDHDDSFPFPRQVPILGTNEPIVFPHMIAPVVITTEAEKQLIDEALRTDRLVGLFPLLDRESNDEEGKSSNAPTLFPVGTLCAVLRMLKIPDGTVRLLVHGISRISIESFVKNPPETVATIQRVNEIEVEDDEVEALKKETLDTLQKAIQLTNMSEDLAVAAMNIEDGGKLADLVATNLGLKIDQLQRVLSETNTKERLRLVYTMLSREVHVLEIGNNISEKVRESVDRNQRDFFLREQIKAMQGELGESDPHESEMGELRDRLAKKQMPDYARKVAERELGRLIALQPAAAEYGVIRTYLEWIIDLPWSECTDDHIDLLKAAKILDEDHYGLDKVKERILEFLAVIRLKGGNLKGPILCLVGPPGVGKTSLGKSIARATGRKFTRFSLGGMRDEAEIRGHRRTYIGAMPGRIVKALKDCGTVNPLIMLDEVDKLGSDFRGDPASALLEVLDPEQNDSFTDHYMDMPINLSKVMFITTANSLDTIPGPLRDRMEIIRIAGYMQSEKLEIAKRYLVPREIENTGLRKSDLRFTPPALRQIISDYTQEAGVRLLQKQIASIARKVARKIAEEESKQEADALKSAPKTTAKGPAKKKAVRRPSSITIKPDDLEKYLGMQKQFNERAERLSIPGVAIGLAWTSFGGEILFVEATRHPGKGRLQLTGQLGEVMKESASAALTFLRANRHILSASDDEFANFDFHVHVPAGATPKDGPSAGVAILIALSSLVTGRLVKDYTAMTGEISLRGNVLAVGGIKEKCLAAHRSGVKEILLPRRNERDLEEIPEAIRKTVKFHFLDRVESALEHALRPVPVARLATPPTHGGKSPGTKVLRPIATPAPRG